MPTFYKPWSGHPGQEQTPGIARGSRELEVLECAWFTRLKANPDMSHEDAKKHFFVDVSQCVSRSPWGRPPSLCRRTCTFSFEGSFCLTGADELMALGFGERISYNHGMTDFAIKDLAGEAFAAPCAAMVLQALFLNKSAPWWSQS
jgi:hypothetical protein